MNWVEELEARGRGGAGLWLGAALAVGTIYGLGVFMLLQDRPAPAGTASAPAVMITLAPMPVAADTSHTQIGQDSNSAPEVLASAPVPVRPPAPVSETPPVPRAEAAPEMPQPIPSLPPSAVAEPAPAPPPPPPPKPVEPAKTAPQETPRPPERPARPEARASRAAEKAAAKVTKSTKTAARRSSAGRQASAREIATWQARLQSHLVRYKRYPVGAHDRGETGTVWVRFRLDRRGRVLSVAIARSSGHADLDRAVLAMVRRAAPMPPPPPGTDPTITAPVQFSLQ